MPETATEEIIDAEIEEEVRHLPAVRASEAVIARGELSVQELVAQKDKVVDVMRAAMREDVHYGKIPGVSKPTLLKPGAEMLNVLLRLAPSYHSDKTFHDGGHLTVVSKCTLTHIPTGLVIAEGEGLCSTYEAKYRWRQAKKTCPDCGAEAIVRSGRKNAYFCISAEGGCGNRYAFGTDKAKEIDAQETGRAENPDLPDAWNTILKMADKRALVASVLNGTGASDVFTQDVEESQAARQEAQEETVTASGAETEKREFDPGRGLLQGAIQGASAEAVKELDAKIKSLNAHVDWRALIGLCVQAQYEVQDRRSLTHQQRDEWWIRLRNASVKMEQTATNWDSVLAASPEQVKAAFSWAFPKFVDEVPMLESATKPQEPSLSDAQAKKLNVLVAQLRKRRKITTEQLYVALAKGRDLEPEHLISLLQSRDEDGELHFGPLRDALTKAEASSLIEKLQNLQNALLEEPDESQESDEPPVLSDEDSERLEQEAQGLEF